MNQQPPYTIRAITANDRAFITQFTIKRWGAPTAVGHGTLYVVADLPGYIATIDDEVVGLITYHIEQNACEIVTIDSLLPAQGIGGALIETVKSLAQQAGCQRLWLITTNDNLNALRFYQKRGFTLVAIQRNALAASRRLKPEIPLIGSDGIPLRDEIELEMMLEGNI